MLAAGPDRISTGAAGSASLAVALASINMFGGFLVTQRMLEMFKKKEPKPAARRNSGDAMSANQLALWYLVASVCFILALKGLSHPPTARRGNVLGMVGMAIAVLVTLALVYTQPRHVCTILVGMAVGGAIGAIVARRVQMTQMPELVAAMHSLVGLAAVLIAIAAVDNPTALGLAYPITVRQQARALHRHLHRRDHVLRFGDRVRQAVGHGSAARRSSFAGQHCVNLAIGIAMIGFGIWFFVADPRDALAAVSS